MEVEITSDVRLSGEQSRLLSLHSFLNILNVLEGELELLGLGVDDDELLAPVIALAVALRNHLGREGVNTHWARWLAQLERIFEASVPRLIARRPELGDSPQASESIANIRSILRVLDARTAERLARRDAPGRWVRHDVSALLDSFRNFFAAVERNSKGRYRIVSNIAAQEERDYVVNLKIESVNGNTIIMPPELQDVFRDLIANARKYTRPGGVITAGLFEDASRIRLVVEDTGVGIPPDEIEKVVDFGYRASNVRHLPTKGGGFGLTKAHAVAKALGGRMWIRSTVGVGTRVTIDIPRPDTISAAGTQTA
ncbi:MAG TPA: ATP-binding protein [Methylomirabilota bacterium]|nr:ATP-binding protein [Methylomirabilota bacterium]